jgi:hypothetical protein
MINTSNENTQVTLTINPQTPNEVVLNIPIRSMGRHDLDLHALQATAIAPNSYGPIVLSTSEPGVIVAELLRVKTAEDSSIDFASVSPLQ